MSAADGRRTAVGPVIGVALILVAGGAAYWFARQPQRTGTPVAGGPTTALVDNRAAVAAKPGSGSPAAPAAAAANEQAPPQSAVVPPPPAAPLKALRQIPRKKLPHVQLDLDGDGKPEQLRLIQQQPARDWKGKDDKRGPRFVLEIRAATADGEPGALLGKREQYGWGQGWSQIGVRIGGGAHVAMAYWGVPEAHEPRASYAWLSEGKVKWGEFKRLPLDLIDLRFSQQEAVLTLSQELYHDYLKRGTTELLAWSGASFHSVLEAPAFEICVVAVREPQVFFAVVAQNKRSLKLMRVSETPDRPMQELWTTAVKPPSEGPAYNVPSGFALSCDRAKGTVQYKRRRFKLDGETLTPLPAAAPFGEAAKKP